jgi:hypothetical protein
MTRKIKFLLWPLSEPPKCLTDIEVKHIINITTDRQQQLPLCFSKFGLIVYGSNSHTVPVTLFLENSAQTVSQTNVFATKLMGPIINACFAPTSHVFLSLIFDLQRRKI